MNIQIAINQCVMQLLNDPSIYRATQYMAKNQTVKVTRQRKLDRRDHQETYIVTFGRPNFAEREFLKVCKQVGEPLPVSRTQIKFYPQKRKAA